MGRTTKRCRQSFGKRKEAEKIISDYQKSIKKTREELADKIENKTAAVLWVTNNSAFMVSKIGQVEESYTTIWNLVFLI